MAASLQGSLTLPMLPSDLHDSSDFHVGPHKRRRDLRHDAAARSPQEAHSTG